MWKHGTTKKGKLRFYCKNCKVSGIKTRKDVTYKKWLNITKDWILEGRKLKHIAKDNKLSLTYIQKKIDDVLETYKCEDHDKNLDNTLPLLLDGFWVVWNKIVVLIAHDTRHVIHWKFTNTENENTWLEFLNEIEGLPLGIVSDAQKGLIKAVPLRFGSISHQRCIAHITRQAKLWLTKNPKTKAGKELLAIVESIHKVRSTEDVRRFLNVFNTWCELHKDFLDEKTPGLNSRPWHTHKKLRAAKSLIKRALDNMFIYTSKNIPNTTNHLEGGINGPLSFVFKEHRGMSMNHKIQAVNLFLNFRVRKAGNQH